MKIIHLVLGKANPDRMNGINRIVHELGCAMVEANLDVEVWGITQDPTSETPERTYPLRLYPLGSSRLRIAPELERDLVALGENACVHLHGALLPQFGIVARILRQHGIAYVVTPHGAYSSAALARKALAKRVYISLVDERVMRGALAIQVNSEREATELEQRLPGLSGVVVPNGQRPHAVRVPYAGNTIEFVYCGRLEQSHKGLDLLIDGFKEYRSCGGRGRLTLIGDGPDASALKQRASCVDDAISFLGSLFGEQKLKRISAANVFVHTSRHEGMPMAVLEAAALGLPLLLSRETNLATRVDAWNAGLIVAPNTPETITRTLFEADELHSSNELYAMGIHARDMIVAEFAWKRVVQRMLQELYGTRFLTREAA